MAALEGTHCYSNWESNYYLGSSKWLSFWKTKTEVLLFKLYRAAHSLWKENVRKLVDFPWSAMTSNLEAWPLHILKAQKSPLEGLFCGRVQFSNWQKDFWISLITHYYMYRYVYLLKNTNTTITKSTSQRFVE